MLYACLTYFTIIEFSLCVAGFNKNNRGREKELQSPVVHGKQQGQSSASGVDCHERVKRPAAGGDRESQVPGLHGQEELRKPELDGRGRVSIRFPRTASFSNQTTRRAIAGRRFRLRTLCQVVIGHRLWTPAAAS